MKYKRLRTVCHFAWVLVFIAVISTNTLAQAAQKVTIGVLAIRGQATLEEWAPTIAYLNKRLPDYNFQAIPLTLETAKTAAIQQEVDFLCTQPGIYIELEQLYGATRLLTMIEQVNGVRLASFGSVIFTKATRDDIRDLADLKGKTFMAVGKDSFAGYYAPWRELKLHAINPHSDFANLSFSDFPQDKVVYAVLNGQADAGSVRTGVLEEMAQEGTISLQDIKVLNVKKDAFPFALSTSLYPNWPFAKLRHTNEELARLVTLALLSKPGSEADSTCWITPLDYTPVSDCLKELQVSPYLPIPITASQVVRQYGLPLLLFAGLVLLLTGNALYLFRCNRQLRVVQEQLTATILDKESLYTALQQDIHLAAKVQLSFLPSAFHNDSVSVQAIFEPYHHVSGDLVNYKWNETTRQLRGYILDVSGHGLPTALRASAAMVMLDRLYDTDLPFSQVLSTLNNDLSPYLQDTDYVTVICFEFDFSRKVLTCASAGIHHFLILSPAGTETVQIPGMPAGMLPESTYEQHELPFAPGTIFVFASDGMMDVLAAASQPLGNSLSQIVSTTNNLISSVNKQDDMTACCIAINNGQGARHD